MHRLKWIYSGPFPVLIVIQCNRCAAASCGESVQDKVMVSVQENGVRAAGLVPFGWAYRVGKGEQLVREQ